MAHPLRKIAVAVYLPATLWGLSQGAILPVVALSAIDRGASPALAAAVSGLIGIGAVITNIPSGMLAGRFGERKAMLVAAAITITGVIMCLLPVDSHSGGLFVLGAALLLIGAAGAVFNLARQAYLAEAVPIEFRARAYSTLGGMHRVGVFVGPFIAAGAIHLWGLTGAFWVSLVAMTLTTVFISRIPDLPSRHQSRRAAVGITTRTVLRDHWRTFLTLGIGVILLCAARQSRLVAIPLWAAHLELSPATSSIIFGIAGAIDALMFYPGGRVMDRHGRRWVAVPCALLLGVSFVVMPLSYDAITLGLVAIVMGFGNGIGSGIVMTLGADTSPPVGRHAFLGVWRELADIGSGIGPLILGGVTAVAGLAAGLLVLGGVGFAAAGALGRWIPAHVAPDRAGRSHEPDDTV
jgi:MFS family permease